MLLPGRAVLSVAVSTGTPTTVKFLKYEHPIGESDCWACWDVEAPLCEEPRCEGHVHTEIESAYTDEIGNEVTVIRVVCDGCKATSTYEWWDDTPDDDDYEEEEFDER